MKRMILLITGILLLSSSCHRMPSIDKVQEATEEGVRDLLTEDNNELLTYRMDRYFLSEQIDDYTFVGTLKATAFMTSPLGKVLKAFSGTDSLKLYRTVIIKFRDKKYESYTITIKGQEE